MKLPGSRSRQADPEPEPVAEPEPTAGSGKGRPTPKRRDSGPKRGPVGKAPTTRREAMQWQKQRAKDTRSTAVTGPTLTAAERRQKMLEGDERYLLRRDQGAVRKLARDYVDSRRMLSNFMLLLLVVLFAVPLVVRNGGAVYGNYVVLLLLIVFIAEWVWTGRRVLALAAERGLPVTDKPFAIGFYAGQRAYLPRKFRQPRPQKNLGDPI